MELIQIFLIVSVRLSCVILATGKPDPTDVQIDIVYNTAKISWMIPFNQGVIYSRIYLNNSKEGDMYLDSGKKHKDIPFPVSSFEIANLKMCSEYYVSIQSMSRSGLSEFITQKFWMTNTTFTAAIDGNVTLSWRTSLTDFFVVMEPTGIPIYVVHGESIIPNIVGTKFKYDVMTLDVSTINIIVMSVMKTDAGLYQSIEYEYRDMEANGCCVLVVTTKPMTPVLTIDHEHPFVNNNITFTCNSTVQRWPGYIHSKLSFQYFGNPRGYINNNTLILNKLTKSDKGMNISCQATDDLGKVSNMSESIILDPYYSPKIIELSLRDKNETYEWSNATIYSFIEDVNLKIKLSIESNPDPQLVLSSSLMKFPPLRYTKRGIEFLSELPSLTCEDSGNFTIQAFNGIKYGDTRTVNLMIYCKPRNVIADFKRIKTKVNKTENIVMQVVSFPKPTVKWTRTTGFVWMVQKDRNDFRYRIYSSIHIKSKDDFGEYGVHVCNRFGCIDEIITITYEDDVPTVKNENPGIFVAGITTLVFGLIALIPGTFFAIRKCPGKHSFC